MTHDHPRPSKPGATFDWVTPAVVTLAICFQIQTDLTIGENAVRVSAADLLSPLLAVFIFVDIRRKGLSLPSWRVPRLWLWLGALTIVMTAALIVGRMNNGAWMPWAVFNKYVGWFALVWYFVLGGWFAGRNDPRLLDSFIRPFLICCWALSLYSLVDFLAWSGFRIDLPAGTVSLRFIGFMKNPNSFGILVAVALAIQMPLMGSDRLFSRQVHFWGTTVLLVGLALSLSRSAWAGAITAVFIMFAFRRLDVQALAAAIALAGLVCVLAIYAYPAAIDGFASLLGTENLYVHLSLDATRINIESRVFHPSNDWGIRIRIESARRAIQMWWESPFTGIGLGSFLWPQLQRNAEHPIIIHSTFLWWLTEFGLIGFAVFVGFFVVCARALACQLRESDLGAELLGLAGLGAIAVFAGASLGMEAMYQRYVWFLLGWALALPAIGKIAAAHGGATR